LELATFFALFFGFTAASSSSLLLGDLNLRRHHHMQVERQGSDLNLCLDGGQTSGTPVSASAASIETCLTRFSGWGHFFWIRTVDGRWLVPDASVTKVPDPLLESSKRIFRSEMMRNGGSGHHEDANASHEGGVHLGGPSTIVEVGSTNYIVHLHAVLPSGNTLFTAEDVTSYLSVDAQFLVILIVVWGGSLLISLLAVRSLVVRVISPLVRLTEEADLVTADNFASQRILIENAPLEVEQLEGSFNRLIDRLALSLDQQRQFAGAVSHELRTPLTIIQGYIKRALRRSDNLTSQQIKALNTVEDEASRITRMVGDLLDLSRADSGRLSFVLEPIQLLPVIQKVIQGATPVLRRSIELDLVQNIRSKDVWVTANGDRLSQVLLNLIENAAKYSPGTTPIVVRVSRAIDRISIAVVDRGIGIPESDIELIFDRFYRSSNATEVGGSGLGLSVVKLLVENMGGRVRVESVLSVGSSFIVELPSCAPPANSSTPA
jgi:signal transduction histidine kinase